MQSKQTPKEILKIMFQTIDYSCWCKYVQFSCSPEFYEEHEKLKEHLKLVEQLPSEIQTSLRTYISHIKQTLYSSKKDFKSALQETMQNDPQGREIINNALESMAAGFQQLGVGVLPGDFGIKEE
jgi:hypothetical protein